MSGTGKRKALIIPGMHRSGASTVAGALDICGWTAPNTVAPPPETGKGGGLESLPLMALNNRILEAFDRNWADPKPLPAAWLRRPVMAKIRKEARSIIETEFGAAKKIRIQDPRLSRLLPFWSALLAEQDYDVRCLIPLRNPLEIALSLEERIGMARNHALLLWQSHFLEAELNSRDLPRSVIDYDDLRTDGRKTLARAMKNLGLPFRPGPASLERLKDYIDGQERRHVLPSTALADAEVIVAPFKDLHATVNTGTVEESKEAFDALRDGWERAWEERSGGDEASSFGALPPCFVKQSRKLEKAGDADAAIAMLQNGVEMDPVSASHHHHLGTILAQQNRLEDANRAYDQAIALDPTAGQFHHDQAAIFRRLGQRDKAISAAKLAIQHDADNADFHLGLAKLYFADQQFALANKHYARALALAESGRRFFGSFAAFLGSQGRHSELVDLRRQEARTAPADPMPVNEIADAMLALGKPGPAFEVQSASIALACAAIGISANPDDIEESLLTLINHTGELDPFQRNYLILVMAWYRARSLVDIWPGPLTEKTKTVSKTKQWPRGDCAPSLKIPKIAPADPEQPAPSLSIMIPVYNVTKPQWLKTCIESVLAEKLSKRDVEIIVVDDASETDTAQKICKSYGARIRYVRNDKNLGILKNHNHCIAMAKGAFVHILHQDDYVAPGFYEALLGPLKADDRLVAAFARTRLINEDGAFSSEQTIIAPEAGPIANFAEMLAGRQLILFPSIIVRRSVYSAIGGFTPSSTFAFDWELWSRIAAQGPVWFDPDLLCHHRLHPWSATNSMQAFARLVDSMRVAGFNAGRSDEPSRRDILTIALYRLLARQWRRVRRDLMDPDNGSKDRKIWAFLLGDLDGPGIKPKMESLLSG